MKRKEIIERFEDAAEYIMQHEQINNVLISGGDPPMFRNEIIQKLLSILSDISHLTFIGFGSRTPVTCVRSM